MFKESLTSHSKPSGLIKYLGLTNWWLTTFTEAERKYINETFQPLGGPSDELVSGNFISYSGNATALLGSLAGWFKKDSERSIAYRLIEKAEAMAAQADVLTRHFLYQAKIQTYYPQRNTDSFALSRATEACLQQIALAPETAIAFKKQYGHSLPLHVGYYQLTVIREKEGNLDEAIRISEQTLKQGWNGDWEERIKRYKNKQQKQAMKKAT